MNSRFAFFSFLFLFFLAFAPLVAAEADTGLSIITGMQTVYAQGELLVVRANPYNDTKLINGSDGPECRFQMFNETNLLVQNLSLIWSGESFVNVLDTTAMGELGRYTWFTYCVTPYQFGQASGTFYITVDGEDKDDTPSEALAAIILIPFLFGFLLLLWAKSMDAEEHGALRIGVSLLALLAPIVSLQFGMTALIRLHYFPAMQDVISSTVFWMTWVYFVFVFYWVVYIIRQAIITARSNKIERLRY